MACRQAQKAGMLDRSCQVTIPSCQCDLPPTRFQVADSDVATSREGSFYEVTSVIGTIQEFIQEEEPG
jgi:hypothetical protein